MQLNFDNAFSYSFAFITVSLLARLLQKVSLTAAPLLVHSLATRETSVKTVNMV